jgi:hypothetical protein
MTGVQGMRLMLLVFAPSGSLAPVPRWPSVATGIVTEGERDLGLAGIGLMFLAFGALCTAAASGISGVLAFGGSPYGPAMSSWPSDSACSRSRSGGRPAREWETHRSGGTLCFLLFGRSRYAPERDGKQAGIGRFTASLGSLQERSPW